MSSSEIHLPGRRQVIALLAIAPLAACGFTPVYGPGGTGDTVQGRISIAAPDSPLAFSLVSRLEDRIGRADTATYLLSYRIETSETALALSDTDDINRINVSGTVAYTVTETGSDVQVQAGEVSTFTAFASSGSPVATAAARRDAQERLMVALADQIAARLLAGADAWADIRE
jgi:LPS-assembly lipoprotein